jgi:acyl carrier protein
MENKLFLLEVVNSIRENKELEKLSEIHETDRLREDYGFTSFDLAELTVKVEDETDIDIFEDGLVNTVGEILAKLEE